MRQLGTTDTPGGSASSGGHPGRGTRVRGIPGLHPPDAGSTSPRRDHEKCPDTTMCPWEAKPAPDENHCSQQFYQEGWHGQGPIILAVVFTSFSPFTKLQKVWYIKVKIKAIRQSEVKVTTWAFTVPRTCKLHSARNTLPILREIFITETAWEIYSFY